MNFRYQLIEKATRKIMLESLIIDPSWLTLDGGEWEIRDSQTDELIELEAWHD